jgi:hypothetical protein
MRTQPRVQITNRQVGEMWWQGHSEAAKDWITATAGGGLPLAAYLGDLNSILVTFTAMGGLAIMGIRLRQHWLHRNDKPK